VVPTLLRRIAPPTGSIYRRSSVPTTFQLRYQPLPIGVQQAQVSIMLGTNLPETAVVPRERIDTTFHETFALSVPAVASVLSLCDEHEGDLTADLIGSLTTLGPNYVKAMPRYARGCGLLEMDSYALTPFGHAAISHDRNLMRPETLWLMHYHLSAPNGPGPAFWNHLIITTLKIGQSIERSETSRVVGEYIATTTSKNLSDRTLESTATAFLGTYAKSDALGRLGILAIKEEGRGKYQVTQPDLPPVWVLGYALADYWEGCDPHSSEMLLKDLGRADGLAGLFFMGPGMLGSLLSELQSAGVVGIKRDAPPFVVMKHWRNREELMDRVYG